MAKTGRTSNEIGNDLEREAQSILEGRRVTQSGGGKFWKCDITDGGRFVWSCKATDGKSIKITGDLIREVKRAARGPQGTGDNYRYGVITEVDGEIMVTLHIEDFAEIITAPVADRAYIQPSKAAERIAATRRSLLG